MELRRPKKPSIPRRLTTLFHDPNPNVGSSKIKILFKNPNIFLVEDFLKEGDVNWLDKICSKYTKTFKSSFTENEGNVEVLSEERTSTFLHLAKGQDSTIRRIEERAAELIGMRSEYLEPLQIVSYTNGQHFTPHHDAGTLNLETGEVEDVEPRRLVTLFVYLNDLPQNQGCTRFPYLNLSVQPQRRSALMFCNVLPNGEVDKRTVHEGCPVEGNLRKFGINIWMSNTSMQVLSQIKPKITICPQDTFDLAKSAFAIANKQMVNFCNVKCRHKRNAVQPVQQCDLQKTGDSSGECVGPSLAAGPTVNASHQERLMNSSALTRPEDPMQPTSSSSFLIFTSIDMQNDGLYGGKDNAIVVPQSVAAAASPILKKAVRCQPATIATSTTTTTTTTAAAAAATAAAAAATAATAATAAAAECKTVVPAAAPPKYVSNAAVAHSVAYVGARKQKRKLSAKAATVALLFPAAAECKTVVPAAAAAPKYVSNAAAHSVAYVGARKQKRKLSAKAATVALLFSAAAAAAAAAPIGGANTRSAVESESQPSTKRQRKLCEHNKRKERCRECGGSSLCMHDKDKSHCRECIAASKCQHGIRKTLCCESSRSVQHLETTDTKS